MSTTYNTTKLSNGVELFYVEAGKKTLPNLVLLHGFPTSSRQFNQLIPRLDDKFHIIAPDLPTYGRTEIPDDFEVSFANIASTIELFLDQLGLKNFSIYIFDYGAPTGLRLALNPKYKIEAIISQNGNAYDEGLGPFWKPLQAAWELLEAGKPVTSELEATLSSFFLELGPYNDQYGSGEPDPTRVDPEDAIIDHALLVAKKGTSKNQLQLFLDYRNNVKLYPQFQAYFAATNVPILAIWGVNDSIFVEPGMVAYKKHSKNVKVVGLDAGHFAGVSHAKEIAVEISKFYSEYV